MLPEYTKMVSAKMRLYGGPNSLHPQVHVRLMLYAHKAVRVQGEIVGYTGGGTLRVPRVDTCACTFCDEVRRGVRVINNATGIPRSAGWSVFGDT